jgi:hypothetical protein
MFFRAADKTLLLSELRKQLDIEDKVAKTHYLCYSTRTNQNTLIILI